MPVPSRHDRRMTLPLDPHSTSTVPEHRARTERTAALVGQLHAVVEELEALYPGRKFPLDGHLVGSLGEAATEVLFDLTLVAVSSAGHDAVAADGRKVEIKATYGTRGVAIRKTSHSAADALIVLRLSRSADVDHEIVFNGPLHIAWSAAGAVKSNGQAPIGLSRLRALNEAVRSEERVALRHWVR